MNLYLLDDRTLWSDFWQICGIKGYDATHAKRFSQNNIPVFACTPDMFSDLMAAAIKKEDLKQWAGDNDIVLKKGILGIG